MSFSQLTFIISSLNISVKVKDNGVSTIRLSWDVFVDLFECHVSVDSRDTKVIRTGLFAVF